MERILALYHLQADSADIEARAQALACEQSIEMPLSAVTDPKVRAEVVASIEGIAQLAPHLFAVQLGIATATTGGEAGQLMNMLFGNCSLQEDVRLIDVTFPEAYLGCFPGPRFGLAGIRQRVEVPTRALTMTALKPQGLAASALAALAADFALAGIDIIKDDHGIANQTYAPFAARVQACQAAVRRANLATGGHTVYAPSLSGGPRQLAEQLKIVREEGVGMVLLCPLLAGIPVLAELAQDLDCPILAHPALAGAARIAPPLLLGKLFRLFGADATIFPNYGGRFAYSRETCEAVAANARAPWGQLPAIAPVPAGGMNIDRVAEMLAVYGPDTILLIGGALLAAGPALPARSREFVAAVAEHLPLGSPS
jgi:ribulose-bisphosphate carboxylase large chain